MKSIWQKRELEIFQEALGCYQSKPKMKKNEPIIISKPNIELLSIKVANLIVEMGSKAIQQRGKFMWALSGGKTPIPIFQKLSTPFSPLFTTVVDIKYLSN